MSFKSLDRILLAIQNQPELQHFQEFQQVVECWGEVVGATAQAHSRPTSISKRILWVATSSASWAQNLMFQRLFLLKKLNDRLLNPLSDIRFSTARWQDHAHQREDISDKQQKLIASHPSYVGEIPPIASVTEEQKSQDPLIVFQRWAERAQARSQHLPVCPQCHCHTPEGELQRWGVCAICTTKQG